MIKIGTNQGNKDLKGGFIGINGVNKVLSEMYIGSSLGNKLVWQSIVWGNYRNVALEGTASSNSYMPAYPPSKAIDGIISQASRWVSENNSVLPFIEVELKELTLVDKVELVADDMNAIVSNWDTLCLVSGEWQLVSETRNNILKVIPIDIPNLKTTKVKIAFTDLGDGDRQRLYEMRIFGSTIIQ